MASIEEGPINCATLITSDGWFMEKNGQWPGQANSLQVKRVIEHKKTEYQDLMVFESETWGNVLVLDGVIQLTEKDEMSYQEMMAHLPMFAHSSPKKVLIIGGGDGGVLREVVKHECVEKVVHCEIDAGVVAAAKNYFPSLSEAFSDERLELVIGDGVAYAEKTPDNTYDVIIIDSSDPVGPAEKLFSKEFYENAHRILAPGGVLCSQGECLWVHADLIEKMLGENGASFGSAEYASIQVPTYPSGQIGSFLARKASPESGEITTCRTPQRAMTDSMQTKLRYYTPAMHTAAFALPAFLERRLCKARASASKEVQELKWV